MDIKKLKQTVSQLRFDALKKAYATRDASLVKQADKYIILSENCDDIEQKTTYAQKAIDILEGAVQSDSLNVHQNVMSQIGAPISRKSRRIDIPLSVLPEKWLPRALGVLPTEEFLEGLAKQSVISTPLAIPQSQYGNIISEQEIYDILLPSEEESAQIAQTEFDLFSMNEKMKIISDIKELGLYRAKCKEMILELFSLADLHLDFQFEALMNKEILPIRMQIQAFMKTYFSHDAYALTFMEEMALSEVKKMSKMLSHSAERIFSTEPEKLDEEAQKKARNRLSFAAKKIGLKQTFLKHKKSVFLAVSKDISGRNPEFSDMMGGKGTIRLNELSSRLEQNKMTIQDLSSENIRLQTELGEVNAKLDLSQSSAEVQGDELQDLTAKKASLEADVARLERQIESQNYHIERLMTLILDFGKNSQEFKSEIDNLPNLTQINEGTTTINVIDLKNPITILQQIAEQIERYANASNSSITMARTLGNSIDYNIYKNTFGSHAYVKQGYQSIQNVTSRLNRYFPSRKFTDFAWPKLYLRAELEMSSFIGPVGAAFYVTAISVPPGAEVEIYQKSSQISKISKEKTRCIVDSQSTESEEEFEKTWSEEVSDETKNSDTLTTGTTDSETDTSGYNVKAGIDAGAVKVGGGYRSSNTGTHSSNNSTNVSTELQSAVNTANTAAETTANRSNNSRESTVSETSQEQLEKTEEEGTTFKFENPSPDAGIILIFFQPAQNYYWVTSLNHVSLWFENTNDRFQIRLPYFPEIAAQLVEENYVKEIVEDINNCLSLDDFAGRNIKLLDMVLGNDGEPAKLKIKNKTYKKLISDQVQDEQDHLYERLYDQLRGIILSIKEIPMRGNGLVSQVAVTEGSALSDLALVEYTNRYKREQIEIETLNQSLRRLTLINNQLTPMLKKISEMEDVDSMADKLIMIIKENSDLIDQKYLLSYFGKENKSKLEKMFSRHSFTNGSK